MTENTKPEIDYHEELNHLAYDIRGCYNEQHRDRGQDSVRCCLGEIKKDEPLEIIEYFGSKFVVGACRRREENFVGYDENSYLKGRPRGTTVTIGAELNEDGSVKHGEGAKAFIICAHSREKTTNGSGSWGIPAKTCIEVNFMTRDPKGFYGFNVRPNEAFADNQFFAHSEMYFNVADRTQLADALLFAKSYQKGGKKQIREAIKNLIKPNEKDAQFAALETEYQNNKKAAHQFAKKRERLKDPVVSKLRQLSSKIENKKTRNVVNTIANNLTENRLTGAGIVTGIALAGTLAGLAGSQMEENFDEQMLSPRKTEIRAEKVHIDADGTRHFPNGITQLPDGTLIPPEGTELKSGIQGPELVIHEIQVNVTRNYLLKNGFLRSSENEDMIDTQALLQKLQKDNLLNYPGSNKTADLNGIYTPEEREGTTEKLEDFAAKHTQTRFAGKLPERMILTLGGSGGWGIQCVYDDMSVANTASNEEKINKLRKNKEDRVDVSISIDRNHNDIYHENAIVNPENSQLVSKADERTAPASVFLDALRAQKDGGNKKA